MHTLYGIKNCDTVKKARTWLDTNQIDYRFHDFRSDGLSREKLSLWLKQAGFDTVINKRSSTWKALDEATRQDLLEGEDLSAIIEQPTLIKRPVLEKIEDNKMQALHFGFKAQEYEHLLSEHLVTEA